MIICGKHKEGMMKQIISRVTAMKKKCKEEFDHFSDKYPVATCALAFLGAPVLLVRALTLTTTVVMLPFGIVFGWI